MAYDRLFYQCRFCGESARHYDMVKYGVRHYAHFACYLDNKPLSDLHRWQIECFPFRLLHDRGLLAQVERLTGFRCAGGHHE